MISRRIFVPTLLIASSCFSACKKSQSTTEKVVGSTLTVLRVESSSPEQAGAEHCDLTLKSCTPLAASQKIPASGVVRTFAGGKVSLDFGAGRRVDLDGLSQLEIDTHIAHLKQGHFSVDSTPLIQKEPTPQPFKFSAAGSTFSSDVNRPTTTALSVDGEQALLTVRRGALHATDLDIEPKVGQSIRVTQARAYRTAPSGAELPSLMTAAPRFAEYGELLQNPAPARRGLGTMSARLPNTDQKREGVRLLKHQVKVTIFDGYARTEVEEEFENTTPHILEGNYRFPIPSDASIARLGLWVGDQLMEGEVLERTRAETIYKSIVDRPVPRDPALLQWENAGELSLRVFPILAHNTRKVLLSYHQTLSAEGDRLRYIYPLSLGAERETQIEDFSIEVVANDTAAELSHPRVRNYDASIQKDGTFYRLQYQAKQFRPQHDFSVVFERATNSKAQLSAHLTQGAPPEPYLSAFTAGAQTNVSAPQARVDTRPPRPTEEGYFGLRFTADLPQDRARPQFRQLSRAIAIDVSHSQTIETIRAQAAFAFGLLLEMDPDEPFVLLACDSACESWSSSQSTAQENVSSLKLPARLAAAHTFLMNLKPGGASDVAGALAAAALELATTTNKPELTHQLVYLGDGHPSAGELSAVSIAARVRGLLDPAATELRVIGAGRSLDLGVLRALAIELGGTIDVLNSGVSLEERIGELASTLRRSVIKNPSLVLPKGLVTADAHALPALHLGQELLISGEMIDLTPAEVTLVGTLDGAPYRLSKKLEFKEQHRKQNPLIENLWAKNRIALLQSLTPSAETKAQIIDLSIRYRTMSRYTSFLVLENDAMYKDFGIDRPRREEETNAADQFMDQMALGESKSSLNQDAPYATDLSSEREDAAPASRGAAPRPSAPTPAKKSETAALESTPSAPSSQGQIAGSEPLTPHLGGSHSKRSQERARSYAPRFHMQASTANDEWRKWGAEPLAQLQQSLNADPNSRARNEAWVRGLIANGRFSQAQVAAHNFFSLDPDHPTAARLFAFSSVVNEDHEQARRMLDVLNEQNPEQKDLHLEASRAFLAVGDVVRACAHLRSVAALDPRLHSYVQEAETCWKEVVGLVPSRSNPNLTIGEAGQLEVRVECDAPTSVRDCPSPLLISPFGEVISPWTPGLGKTDQARITLLKLRTGTYRLLISGGSPSASGKVKVIGRNESTSLKFTSGTLHTVGHITLSYY